MLRSHISLRFDISSEAVSLELEAPHQDVTNRGEAKIAGIPFDPAEVIHFIGMGSHPERLDPIEDSLDE
jgi:hypothetical protein